MFLITFSLKCTRINPQFLQLNFCLPSDLSIYVKTSANQDLIFKIIINNISNILILLHFRKIDLNISHKKFCARSNNLRKMMQTYWTPLSKLIGQNNKYNCYIMYADLKKNYFCFFAIYHHFQHGAEHIFPTIASFDLKFSGVLYKHCCSRTKVYLFSRGSDSRISDNSFILHQILVFSLEINSYGQELNFCRNSFEK